MIYCKNWNEETGSTIKQQNEISKVIKDVDCLNLAQSVCTY